MSAWVRAGVAEGPAVTVCMPTIPPRAGGLRQRALASVWAQEYPAAALALAVDTTHAGAWATRQRALEMARTPWVAFLDDDDEWLPQHLARLLWCQQRTRTSDSPAGADLVFSWFVPVGMADMVGMFGRPFDPARPHTTTSTILVRTGLALEVGFTPPPRQLEPEESTGEDDRFVRGCVALGATVVHLPERTWRYHYHHANTSGRGDKW
jgi:glycosyltransferase involved in cell wall biosynthesis